MKIIIAGGSGQVGRMLCRAFVQDGHRVVVLSRATAESTAGAVRIVPWDGRLVGAWCAELEDADVIINLAGRSVNCRYTPERRSEIMDSRIESTRAIGLALRQAVRPPRVWLQASTATIYAHRFDAANDDVTGIIGGEERGAPSTWRFSIDVATAWEKAATAFAGKLPGTRLVLMRSAMTMSPDAGGIFDMLLRLTRFGLGGRAASGRQYISWIHERDFIRAVYWSIEHEELAGAVNLCSPTPLPNKDFMRALRHAWGIPVGLPALRWMLEIGALALQTETELILKSRRVIPTRLLQSGFSFEFPNWHAAAADLCRAWRQSRRGS